MLQASDFPENANMQLLVKNAEDQDPGDIAGPPNAVSKQRPFTDFDQGIYTESDTPDP